MSPESGVTGQRFANLSQVARSIPPGAQAGISVSTLDGRRSFNHGSNTVFSSASTIKIVILAALAQAIDSGRISLDDRTAAGSDTRVGGSGVLNWLSTDLELTLRDHAWLMIAISDNTASNVLIDAIGLPAISDCQASLGLDATSLNRRFIGRLPNPGQPENLATASDLVQVLRAIWLDTAASPASCAWMRSLLAEQKYLDRLPRHLPESLTYAGKTGSLTGYAHDCGVLSGPGGTLAIAVLTSGFESSYSADAWIGDIALAAVTDFALTTPAT